jgi:hypothetical protein
MKEILFYTFLGIFTLTALVTLCGLVSVAKIKERYLRWLFSALIIQLIGAVIGLYKTTDFFPPANLSPIVSPSIDESEPSFKAVHGFYIALQHHDYTNAYALLAPELIKERKWTPENFRAGYLNTVQIALLKITLESTASEFSHSYVVYYLDEANSSLIPELGNPNDLVVSQLPELIQRLEKLKTRVVSLGGKPETIDNLTVQQLTSFDVGNKIEWSLMRDSKVDFLGKLGRPLLCKSVVGRRIVVEKRGVDWIIRSITPLENTPGN